MDAANGVVLWLMLAGLSLAPALIAWARAHHQRVPILVVTLLLGWTCLGWVVALAWSLSAVPDRTEP